MTRTYTVSREEELLTLLNPRYGFHLLGQFTEPCTASEAARRMGEHASKLSYHVGRLQELGLLLPAPEGQGRGQHLRAVAQRFVLAPSLVPILNNETIRPMLDALCESFLASSEVPEHDPAQEYVLMDWSKAQDAPALRQDWSQGRRGVEVQPFHLPPARYAALMNDLQRRIREEVQASQETKSGKWHTVALWG